MNPRQRRGVLFVAIAFVGAVAVFFSVLAYVNDVEAQVGDKVTAYVATSDVEAYTPLTPDDVTEVDIPAKWLPPTAMRNLGDLTGQVASAPIPEGTLMQGSNMIPQPSLQAGQREVAILVDAETGVAGKILPGSYVDVWATFGADTTGIGNRTKVIAQQLLVIDIGLQVDTTEETASGIVEPAQQVPVTFATSDGQVKALTYAESFASEVRLVLRPPGDDSLVPGSQRSYEETFGLDEDDTGGEGRGRDDTTDVPDDLPTDLPTDLSDLPTDLTDQLTEDLGR